MEIATKQDFEDLQKQVLDLAGYVSLLSEKALMPDVVYISDIARIERLSVTGIKKEPWLLPDFGESEYPGRCRWKYSTFKAWRDIPVHQRKTMWEARMHNKLSRYTETKEMANA